MKLLFFAAALLTLIACTGPESRLTSEVEVLEPVALTVDDMPALIPPELVDDMPPTMVLGPGDELDIEVYGQMRTREITKVGIDGLLYYGPLAGIQAHGKTLNEVQDALTTGLTDWYVNPRVLISVREIRSRRATILGRVSTPGSVALGGGERVLDLVSAAGGLATSRFSGSTEELADLSGAMYIRDGVALPIDMYALVKEGDLQYNIHVHPGDHVYIPSSLSREVYVIGAVQKPKSIGFGRGLTIVRAIAMASGGNDTAYLDRVLLLRGSAAEPRAIQVNALEIIAGNQPDILLEPKDVIWVPGRGQMNPEKLFDLGANAFVAGAFARLGAAAWNASDPTVIQVSE